MSYDSSDIVSLLGNNNFSFKSISFSLNTVQSNFFYTLNYNNIYRHI